MKKIISLYLGLLILFLVCSLVFPFKKSSIADADFGPKPSVVIEFEGLSEFTYYVTLLSKTNTTGPYSASTDENDRYYYYCDNEQEEAVADKFLDYQDIDGYYYLQFMQKCEGNDTFVWGYYPPNDFKVLIYIPQNNKFFISSFCERYAFDSYFSVDVNTMQISSVNPVQIIDDSNVERNYDYFTQVWTLLVRIILTIAIEIGVALLFGYRTKKYLFIIVIANLITQIALNVALNIIAYSNGPASFIATYAALELLVFVVEALIYISFFSKMQSSLEFKKRKSIIFSFVSNTVSFAFGLGLAMILPGIF